MKKLKIIVCFGWFFFVVVLISQEIYLSAPSQASGLRFAESSKPEKPDKPETAEIEFFDKAVQQRFLTQPSFGITRILPAFPPNPHFSYFDPVNDEERKSLEFFKKEGWKVSIYLFGKRTEPKIIEGQEKKKFIANYRLNKPIPVTRNLKGKTLQSPKRLLSQVKKAFTEFQTPNSPNENRYEFNIGDWAYVTKPVRAVNQSCLQCHADYVMTRKLNNGQYSFRKRKIGDANGILVYGFSKD